MRSLFLLISFSLNLCKGVFRSVVWFLPTVQKLALLALLLTSWFGVYAQNTSLTKSVSPLTIPSGGTATYTFTLDNTAVGNAQSNLSFTDNLPSGLRLAANPNVIVTGLTGGTVTAVGGGNSVAVSGYSQAANSMATITVNVTNMPGQGNASCGSNPAAFTNTAANIVNVSSNITNNVGDVCLMVSPMPFTCNPDIFLIQDSNTALYGVVTSANPFTFPIIGSPAGYQYNASGFNPNDGYIYAMKTFSNNLLRIDASGAITDMGVVTGLPAATGTTNYNSGEIDHLGNYYIKHTGANTTMYRVNISTRVATEIVLTQSTDPSDLAYSVTTGLLYGVGTNGRLFSINPSGGTVTFIGTSPGAAVFGALFGSSTGHIYGINNAGDFFQFNLTTGLRTLISSAPSSGNNDGAHCVTAPITFSADLSVNKTDNSTTYTPGTNSIYAIVARNNGPFGVVNANVLDNVPAGIPPANVSYTAVATAGSSTSVVGTQSGAINDMVSLAVNGTVTYTVTIAVPLTFTGDLVNTVTVTPPTNINDADLSNNQVTDTNVSFCSTDIDSDGDGISDFCDLDDDNDGILDIDENCTSYLAQNINGAWLGATTSTLTVSSPGSSLQTNIQQFDDGQDRYQINQNGGGQRIAKAGNIDFTYTFSTAVPASEIAFHIEDLDPTTGGSTNPSYQITINGGAPNSAFGIKLLTGFPNLDYNASSGSVTVSNFSINDYRMLIKGLGNTLVSSFRIISTGVSASDNVAYSIFSLPLCDTDGDGIPNRLDLDSDNDGCVDALEGDENVTSAQLATATGTVIVGFGSSASNENLGNAVNLQGIPTIVNAGGSADVDGNDGQGIGTSQNALVNFCTLNAPGGVTGPDFWVKSDDAGTIATAWKDHSFNADNIPNEGAMTLSPADRAHNFHPYTTGYTASKYFYNTNSVLNFTNNYLDPSMRSSVSIFSAVRPTTANGTGRITGIDDDANAAEPGISIRLGLPYIYKYFGNGGAQANSNTMSAPNAFMVNKSSVFSAIQDQSLNSGRGERRLGLDGTYENFNLGATTNTFNVLGKHLKIGYATWDVNGAFPGDIMEVVWFKRPLTANEQSRVNSYLAVKNGTTLNENYLSTASTVVWDRTINAGYNSNIFGIARDNITALHQKQSGSVNSGQQLVISTTGFTNSNAANSTNLASDLQYLITGDNGLKQSLIVPLTYTVGSNGTTNYRFESIWKVQNTNTVGTVTVAWPKGVRNLYLVQSPDAAFDGTDTFTPMAAEVTVNGLVYNTANVTLTDGQFFTFAGFGNAPGGVVTGLSYWYRADLDATNTGAATDVTAWKDVWNGTTVAQLGTNALPKYAVGTSSYFNFNPGINFTAGTQTLGNTTVRTLTSLDYDVFTFTKEGLASGGGNPRLFSVGMDNTTTGISNWDAFGIFPNNSNLERRIYGGGTTFPAVAPAFSTTIPSIMYFKNTNTNSAKGLNGAAMNTAVNYSAINAQFGGHMFGNTVFSSNGSDNAGFTGHIGETIVYGDGTLTTTERRRVDSYLAIKYGITLGQVNTDHYLDADAAMVWNGAANTTYNNNIFGVTREDIGLFEQKVSKSVNVGTILTVATINDFVNPNNAVSRTSFTNDKTYFLLGDNNVTVTPVVDITIAGNTWKRIQRAWLSQRKNTPNTLYFEADLSAYGINFASTSAVRMLVADDAAFTTNVAQITGTFAGGKWVFSNNFDTNNAQRYITFAGIVPDPCTNPGTFDTAGLPSTTGISNLAGFTGGATGWPANVPNGHVVIESKNKGFVITRVSSSAAITSPVEGMLIYDIAAACVKLYNGTTWNCLAKDCL